MRDISRKVKTLRTATARSILKVSPSTVELIRRGEIPKGDPLPVARVAAIQAAKRTSDIIPYCHPLPIDFVGVDFELGSDTIISTVSIKTIYRTGVEMEALTAASVAALTLYDMMKMLDNNMEVLGVKLVNKRGGKSDFQPAYEKPLRGAVLVVSDSIAAGSAEDLSGKLIVERLRADGVDVCDYKIVPDDAGAIADVVRDYADQNGIDLVITTGGTGLSPRDCTPEAMKQVIDHEVPGIAEAVRSYGQERMPYSMLSRGIAGVRGNTLIINLPGSAAGVSDSLDALFPAVLHAIDVVHGGGHQRKHG